MNSDSEQLPLDISYRRFNIDKNYSNSVCIPIMLLILSLNLSFGVYSFVRLTAINRADLGKTINSDSVQLPLDFSHRGFNVIRIIVIAFAFL